MRCEAHAMVCRPVTFGGVSRVDDDIPYLLLTPGPLTTSRTVREAMLRDYSTWDVDYNTLVNQVRSRLVGLATDSDRFTSVLMQGSGTFGVEATLGSVVPADRKVLIVNNGAYGRRMVEISRRLNIDTLELKFAETEQPDPKAIDRTLESEPDISHVAMVHCETTTGQVNPAESVGEVVARLGRSFILDAMSSFGGMPMSMESLNADYLISSANKCIQGVPGFSFVIADRQKLESSAGQARSLSLDLYDQWREMEKNGGKWRYTSPTHTVCAFAQALEELEAEGGVAARHNRYAENQRLLVDGLATIGLRTLIAPEFQSPIITAFYSPVDERFEFGEFYSRLKSRRFVIYPGKVSQADTFRIGTIGHVFADDIRELVTHIAEVLAEMNVSPAGD
jgi:2-aminoethylphosphonate-pyruvate transaminase